MTIQRNSRRILAVFPDLARIPPIPAD